MDDKHDMDKVDRTSASSSPDPGSEGMPGETGRKGDWQGYDQALLTVLFGD